MIARLRRLACRLAGHNLHRTGWRGHSVRQLACLRCDGLFLAHDVLPRILPWNDTWERFASEHWPRRTVN